MFDDGCDPPPDGDLDDEWRAYQGTMHGQVERLGVQFDNLRRALVAATPRLLRPGVRWWLYRRHH